MSHPTAVAKKAVRIGFGLALALVGVAHYMDAANFAEAVGRGLEFSVRGTEINVLVGLGFVWGYLLPGLMIVGGVFMAFGYMPAVGTLLAGVALLSIPAGLMLKSVLSGLSLNDTMPPAMNAIIWVLFYMAAARGFCCTGDCCAPAAKPMQAPARAPIAPAPRVIAKAPAKKPVGKKK